jgi:ABC-type Fe3+ transport system substrate-binding protein
MGAIRIAVTVLTALVSPRSGEGGQRVVIITPHVDAIRNEFSRGFADWHRQQFGETAEVDWRTIGGTSDSLKFVQSEFAKKPDGIGIDIFFGGGQEPYLILADKNLTTGHRPPAPVLDAIPRTLGGMEVYDAEFRWFSAALSSFGILQNTRVQRLAGLPQAASWQDLADPKLFGWVGTGDPRNSGTMKVMFEAFLQAYGWEKGWGLLAQIGGNARNFDRVSSSTAKDVTLGETAFAFAIDFYGASQISVAGRSNMVFTLPGDFTAINGDGICILKGATNLTTARRFLDFTLGEPGQKLWFLPLGYPEGPRRHALERSSIRPDFYKRYRGVSNIEVSPFELNQSFTYDAKLARDRNDLLGALIGALLVDTHAELKAAWREIIARGLRPSDLVELGRPPLSEAEALRLASTGWKNAALRNRKKIEWQNWAKEKYRRLLGG